MGKFAHKPKKYASLPFKLRIIRVQQDAPRIARHPRLTLSRYKGGRG